MKVAIVVASNRWESMRDFVEMWGIRESDLYTLFVIEDNPVKTFRLPECVEHYAHEDIPFALRSLVPRRTSGIKTFGIYLAYLQDYDYFLVLDDDCYPSFEYPTVQCLIHSHLAVLTKSAKFEEYEGRCFMTMEDEYARGFPDSEKFGTPVPIKVSVGSWIGIPDIDGRTQMWYEKRDLPMPSGKLRSQVVGKGVSYVFSGMHACFDRSVAPFMYFFPTGDRFYRYDDIWLGFMMKRLMDWLGYSVHHSGEIFILHSRQSNSARNHELEGMNQGYDVNDKFYRTVQETYALNFESIPDLIRYVSEKMGMPYFTEVLSAYGNWINLFSRPAGENIPAEEMVKVEKNVVVAEAPFG